MYSLVKTKGREEIMRIQKQLYQRKRRNHAHPKAAIPKSRLGAQTIKLPEGLE